MQSVALFKAIVALRPSPEVKSAPDLSGYANSIGMR